MRTSFPLRLAPGRQFHPALALIAAHGISDLDRPGTCLPVYLLCAVTPLPRVAVTCAFVVASFVHFAGDVGWRGSAALTLATCGAGVCGRSDFAGNLMSLYMILVHLPLHYRRLALTHRRVGLAMVIAFTVLLLFGLRSRERICLSQDVQRLILAHVVHNCC
jgi:hypothetical protein